MPSRRDPPFPLAGGTQCFTSLGGEEELLSIHRPLGVCTGGGKEGGFNPAFPLD